MNGRHGQTGYRQQRNDTWLLPLERMHKEQAVPQIAPKNFLGKISGIKLKNENFPTKLSRYEPPPPPPVQLHSTAVGHSPGRQAFPVPCTGWHLPCPAIKRAMALQALALPPPPPVPPLPLPLPWSATIATHATDDDGASASSRSRLSRAELRFSLRQGGGGPLTPSPPPPPPPRPLQNTPLAPRGRPSGPHAAHAQSALRKACTPGRRTAWSADQWCASAWLSPDEAIRGPRRPIGEGETQGPKALPFFTVGENEHRPFLVKLRTSDPPPSAQAKVRGALCWMVLAVEGRSAHPHRPPHTPHAPPPSSDALPQVSAFITVAFALYSAVLVCITVVLLAIKRLGLLNKPAFFILLSTAVLVVTVLGCLVAVMLLQEERLVRAYRKEDLRQLGDQVRGMGQGHAGAHTARVGTSPRRVDPVSRLGFAVRGPLCCIRTGRHR